MNFPLSTYLNLILVLDEKRPGFIPQFGKEKEDKFEEYLDSLGDIFKKTWIINPHIPGHKGSLLVHTKPLPFNPNDKRRKNRIRDIGILLGYPEECVEDHIKIYSGNRKKNYIDYVYTLKVEDEILYIFTCSDKNIDIGETIKGYEESLGMKINLTVEMKDYSIVFEDFNGKTVEPIPGISKNTHIIVNGKRYRKHKIKNGKIYLYQR